MKHTRQALIIIDPNLSANQSDKQYTVAMFTAWGYSEHRIQNHVSGNIKEGHEAQKAITKLAWLEYGEKMLVFLKQDTANEMLLTKLDLDREYMKARRETQRLLDFERMIENVE